MVLFWVGQQLKISGNWKWIDGIQVKSWHKINQKLNQSWFKIELDKSQTEKESDDLVLILDF